MRSLRVSICISSFIAVFLSCTKDVDETAFFNETSGNNSLQVWQQRTKGSVQADIDGVEFAKSFEGTIASSNTGKFVLTTSRKNSKQKLTVSVCDEATKDKIVLAIVDFKGVGTYLINEIDTSLVKGREAQEIKEASFVSYSSEKSGKESSWNNFTDTKEIKQIGTVEVTKFNPLTREVEGTFVSTVKNKTETNVSTKSITKGKFSGTFAVVNF